MKLLSYKLRKQQADTAIYKIRNPESGAIECRLEKIQQSFEKFYNHKLITTFRLNHSSPLLIYPPLQMNKIKICLKMVLPQSARAVGPNITESL